MVLGSACGLGSNFVAVAQFVAAHGNYGIALVRAGGMSYEEAAQIMGCKLGTIKSRVNRADAALRAALGGDFRARRTSRQPDEGQVELRT